MKGKIFLIGISIFLLTVFGCSNQPETKSNGGSSGGSTSLKNVPSQLCVAIPVSLTNSSVTISGSYMRSSGSSMAYQMITSQVFAMNMMTGVMAMYLVMIDSVIDGLSPSSSVVSGKHVTITADLKNKMLAAMPEGMDKASLAASIDSTMGQSMAMPDFYFSSTNGGYDYIFYFSARENGQLVKTFWSSDKTKLKMIFDTESTGSTNTMAFVNDSSADETKLYFVEPDSSMTMSLKQKAGDTAHGVYLCQSYKTASGNNFSIDGFADDNGGFAVAKILQTSGVAVNTLTYEEGFNAVGNVTYQKINGVVQSGTAPAGYSSEYTNGSTQIDDMKDNNNDSSISETTNDICYPLAAALEGESYIVFNANLTSDINAYNANNSVTGSLPTSTVGSAYCEKDGTVRLYIQSQALYSGATTLYFSKVTQTTSYNFGAPISVAK